jgi:hypothetical protein
MVDPGAAQALVKQLNRWYRKKATPRGTADHYHRGTRMSYTAASRAVVCLFSLLLLSVACVLYFAPNLMADKPSLVVLGLKIAWLGIVVVAFLAPVQAFREFVVINEEGVMKSDLFGRQTRFGWNEILSFRINPDDNKVIFRTADPKAKLKMSLAYDGWRDFLELAGRRLDPALNFQLVHALATLDAKRTISRSTKKVPWAKWFPTKRSP